MKKFLTFLFASCLVFTLNASMAHAYKLSGRVFDRETGAPLPGANVLIEDMKIGLPSDESGYFTFPNVPGGKHTLSISYVGYEVLKKTVNISGDVTGIELGMQPTLLPGETIVITATRARVRYSPATFSNLTSEDLKERYTTQDIPVLLSELPSTSFYSESGNGIGYNYLSLRGFDQRRISVMINGIPQNDPEDHNVYWIDFPDLTANLQDIQVQRGAGSSFYGPPAIGGSVNMVTSVFSPDPETSVSFGYGSFNTQKYSLKLNSGLINNSYSFYGRFSKILSDGYRNDSWVDFLSYFFGAAKYTERTTTRLHVYGGPIKDHLAYYGIPKDKLDDREERKTNYLSEDPEVRDQIENFFQPHYELISDWKINDKLSLSNSVFYVQGDGFFDYDGSWADTSYYRITSEYGFHPTGNPGKSIIRAFVGNKQGGWLPRLRIDHRKGVLNVGGEVRYHQSLHWGSVKWAQNLPEGVPSDRHYYEYKGAKTIVSGYLDEYYHLNERVSIRGSFQAIYNKYRIFDEKFVGNDFGVKYLFFNPRLGVNFNLSDNLNAYFSFSRTEREPRLKTLYDAAESSDPWSPAKPQFETDDSGNYNFDKPLVEPEVLNDFELGMGLRSEYVNGTLNVFWMDFRNEIVKKGDVDRFGQPVTGNAERTRHMGIEVALSAQPFKGVSLSANASYSRNTLDRYTYYDKQKYYIENPDYPDSIIAFNLDGNRIAGFPDLILNARVSYRYGNLNASLWTHYESRKYANDFEGKWYLSGKERPETVVDPYTVLNASLSYSLQGVGGVKSIGFDLQVFNILDELYATQGSGPVYIPAYSDKYGKTYQFFPSATRSFYLGVKVGI